MVVRVYSPSYRVRPNSCKNGLCAHGPCMCDKVIRHNDYRNVILPGSNRGIMGELLDSDRFKNCPSAEEYGRVLRSGKQRDIQAMFSRIPKVV